MNPYIEYHHTRVIESFIANVNADNIDIIRIFLLSFVNMTWIGK